MNRVLGIIPARAGSKRLPRKNVQPLSGKPLVGWAIEAALGAKRLDRMLVSSDDSEVLEIAQSYGEGLGLVRPGELAEDCSPAIDYVRHALAEVPDGDSFGMVVIIQPSSPLVTAGDIDATIQLLLDSGADSSVSVMKVDHAIHPIKLKRMQGDRLVGYFEEENNKMAAHELPELYVRNCAVYASKRSVIESGRIIGDDCRGYLMPRERSIDINDRIDYDFACFLKQQQQD